MIARISFINLRHLVLVGFALFLSGCGSPNLQKDNWYEFKVTVDYFGKEYTSFTPVICGLESYYNGSSEKFEPPFAIVEFDDGSGLVLDWDALGCNRSTYDEEAKQFKSINIRRALWIEDLSEKNVIEEYVGAPAIENSSSSFQNLEMSYRRSPLNIAPVSLTDAFEKSLKRFEFMITDDGITSTPGNGAMKNHCSFGIYSLKTDSDPPNEFLKDKRSDGVLIYDTKVRKSYDIGRLRRITTPLVQKSRDKWVFNPNKLAGVSQYASPPPREPLTIDYKGVPLTINRDVYWVGKLNEIIFTDYFCRSYAELMK